MVDGTFREEDVELIKKCVRDEKLQVIFSPVNLVEAVRCFEKKETKAQVMIQLSKDLCSRIAKPPSEIIINDVNAFISHKPTPTIIPKSDTIFDTIREDMLNNLAFIVPQEFHNEVKRWNDQHIRMILQMKNAIDEMVEEDSNGHQASLYPTDPIKPQRQVDFYNSFNRDPSTRQQFLTSIIKDRCNCNSLSIPNLPSAFDFDSVESLSIFLRFYFAIAYEYVIQDKCPKDGDWADLDQTVYFSHVDYVITSDTGNSGAFPNYREIVHSCLTKEK